ncbi:hypothetical protein LC087_11930 [Bacillus carboniphilus]|uniref:Uncharacterized protein n=1 Tax=Bacillus carboniphilus TaxID=86663 RepID=A0ABY9JQB3_9BACI|nr:hypothetical protein [Bacillus carboniphilus]WLR41590.1 hypothetical protein LC087_11930 [Bacillus carboniphilus]
MEHEQMRREKLLKVLIDAYQKGETNDGITMSDIIEQMTMELKKDFA